MAREFTLLIERDEDGYLVGSVPALRGAIPRLIHL